MPNEDNTPKIKTKNVLKALRDYSESNAISLKNCDFKVYGVTNFIKTYADDEFIQFNREISELSNEEILNNHMEFEQIYEISLHVKEDFSLRLNYTIDYGDFSANPKIILQSNSVIPYKTKRPKEIFSMLVEEFNKIKIRHNILINIFDEKMINNLKIFTKYLYQGKFKKRVKIPLFTGIEPTLNKQSKLILWFQEKNHTKNRIIEVDKGEVLVEYLKPVFGEKGLNAFGEILDSEYGRNAEDLDASINRETIEIKENKYKKLYISKKKGFVSLINHYLSVDNTIKMDKLSRVEKSLEEDEDNNIEVFVAQHDTDQDSIGEGVKLTTETIHVTGHVGAKSVLEAINLTVDGATHQDSTQFAKFAQINRHKGVLRCHDAKIKLLEGGKVHATNVEIEASLGGTVYAKNVKINLVKSHLKVYASDFIEIEQVKGEDNIFKINYRDVPIVKSKLNYINSEIDETKYEIEECKKNNLEKLPELKEKLTKLKNEALIITDSVQKAKISVKKTFNGLNTIIFTIDDKNEIFYKTQAQAYEPFYLEIKEEEVKLLPVNKYLIIKQK